MRRTDQEFKDEILRRAEAHRARQRQIRKKALTAAACCVLVFTGFFVSLPLLAGGGSADSAANGINCAPQEAEGNDRLLMGNSIADMESAAEAPEEVYSMAPGSMGIVTILLSEEDAAVIRGYLEAEWVGSLTNCACDYLLIIGDWQLCYSSECGSFQDYGNGSSLTVAEENRVEINKILENYLK